MHQVMNTNNSAWVASHFIVGILNYGCSVCIEATSLTCSMSRLRLQVLLQDEVHAAELYWHNLPRYGGDIVGINMEFCSEA